jgi:xanthine dehydrogenase YagR molybdenum-binding subunit
MSGTTSPAIGAPVNRIDGRAKVTGAARYTAESDYPGLVHAVMVTSTVAQGRVTAVDAGAAERVPGVLAVLTHRNAPRLAPAEPSAGDAGVAPPGGNVRGWAPADGDVFSRVRRPLQSEAVAHHGDLVALAVAETPLAAHRAAELVRVDYAAEPPAVSLAAQAEAAFIPGKLLVPLPPESSHGDVDAALAAAPIVVDRRYRHPPEHHNPMELAATTAAWTADGELLVHDATQDVSGTRRTLAKSFGMPEDRIRVLAAFLGGGFGCKHPGRDHTVLAALAARAVGRPVRLVASRAQMFRPQSATGRSRSSASGSARP